MCWFMVQVEYCWSIGTLERWEHWSLRWNWEDYHTNIWSGLWVQSVWFEVINVKRIHYFTTCLMMWTWDLNTGSLSSNKWTLCKCVTCMWWSMLHLMVHNCLCHCHALISTLCSIRNKCVLIMAMSHWVGRPTQYYLVWAYPSTFNVW